MTPIGFESLILYRIHIMTFKSNNGVAPLFAATSVLLEFITRLIHNYNN